MQEIVEPRSREVNEDGDPAEHPQSGGLLPVTEIYPREERHKDAHHSENDYFL